jgi:hypothetical protein
MIRETRIVGSQVERGKHWMGRCDSPVFFNTRYAISKSLEQVQVFVNKIAQAPN